MFYLVGKIAWLLVTPSNALILLGLAGIAFLWSRHERVQRRGRVLLATTISALAIFGLTPLSPLALSVLEQRFPPLPASSQIDGIILLGGGLNHYRCAVACGSERLARGSDGFANGAVAHAAAAQKPRF